MEIRSKQLNYEANFTLETEIAVNSISSNSRISENHDENKGLHYSKYLWNIMPKDVPGK